MKLQDFLMQIKYFFEEFFVFKSIYFENVFWFEWQTLPKKKRGGEKNMYNNPSKALITSTT